MCGCTISNIGTLTRRPMDKAAGSAVSRSAARSSSAGLRGSSTASARPAAFPTPITSSSRRRQRHWQRLPGFSKWVYDVTGYYEKNGFQARASYRHRSAFKGEIVSLFSNLGFPLSGRTANGPQVGYTFQPGSRLDGLGILLQVSNVLNSPYRTPSRSNGTQTLETYREIRTIVAAWRELPFGQLHRPAGRLRRRRLRRRHLRRRRPARTDR